MPETRVLNVAEKPSVARALARVFSGMPNVREMPMRRDPAAQIFESQNVVFPRIFAQGQGRTIQGPMESHTMITTSVRGHLASQDFGPEFGWTKCDPIALFDAPIETQYRDDMAGLARMLTSLAKNCQCVILWLDCDREGEAIADEVREVCLTANSRLKHFRARFSTVLAPEILRALKSLDSVNESFVQAVQARSQIDLRVGAAFTRFQTLRLQKKFAGFADKGVVSYGGCQFPTLGFIVSRWAAIQTFIEEDFWFLDLTLRVPENTNQQDTDNNSEEASPPSRPQGGNLRSINFTWKRGRLYDRQFTLVLYESCLEAGEATVTQLRGNAKNKWRPVPLSTVELQKRASRYLKIGSETLMSAAEELYQSGYISYPRTETEIFRPEFQHRPLIQDLAASGGEFREYAAKLLVDNNFQRPRAGRNDDKAHPPITPCKAVDPNTITDPTRRNIYRLIVKHYLACCSRDAIGRETHLTVRIASEDFTAKGLMVLEKNWLEVYYPWEKWSTGQGELPPLEVGSRVVPSSLTMKEGWTTPPLPISEVELISLMDRNGIGTDATIAQHITTVQERSYATKDARQLFTPSPLGISLVEAYNSMGYQLNKPDLRREMEAECNQVASGVKSKGEIMGPILAKMRECFVTARNEAQKLDDAVSRRFARVGSDNQALQVLRQQFSLCGSCNLLMTLKEESNGAPVRNGNGTRRKRFLCCETCQQGWGLPRGHIHPRVEGGNIGPPVVCPICSFQVLEIKAGDGYEGNGYSICPRCFSDPPLDYGGTADGRDFRCFSCTHQTCPLASGTPGGDVELFPCPFCEQSNHRNQPVGKVRIRKNSRGFILSCSNYRSRREGCQYTIWLPKECQAVTTSHDDRCGNCSTGQKLCRKITISWKPGSVPPSLDRVSTVCILCDGEFRQFMSITLPQYNQITTNPRRRGAGERARPSRGQSGGGGGGGACYKCGQPGHYASNCPQTTRS
jgi:DNA topoisomerase-3